MRVYKSLSLITLKFANSLLQHLIVSIFIHIANDHTQKNIQAVIIFLKSSIPISNKLMKQFRFYIKKYFIKKKKNSK